MVWFGTLCPEYSRLYTAWCSVAQSVLQSLQAAGLEGEALYQAQEADPEYQKQYQQCRNHVKQCSCCQARYNRMAGQEAETKKLLKQGTFQTWQLS